MIVSGWYFAPELSHSLYGNVPVNGLNEWDVNKLGWSVPLFDAKNTQLFHIFSHATFVFKGSNPANLATTLTRPASKSDRPSRRQCRTARGMNTRQR